MEFIEYKDSKDKEKLLQFLENAEWKPGPLTAKKIKDGKNEEKFGKDGGLFFYLENDKPLAFGSLVKEDYIRKPGLKPWIAMIYIDPKARGKRLSEKMTLFLEDKAKELGYDKAYIMTQHKDLYEKYGYKLQEVIYGDKHGKDYFYKKSLK
ncbi:GNAT family N-acetyltransferase [Anaerococcus sp. WCA-380-WT-2B]|uniref:GNAT family N-acetyltransferase n=1 Tax=Anaerococcus porci TaxID=2652269 RepID=A0A6N7VHH9_9FIRM|nr:GNAT family N-acetyltransferase [Anaerococcus porci]MSS78351.1 GNAT family N-acetyltransferase [Anaerococcus porci]